MKAIQVYTVDKEVYTILDAPIKEYHMSNCHTYNYHRQVTTSLEYIVCSDIEVDDVGVHICFTGDKYDDKASCIFIPMGRIKKIYFNYGWL